MDDEVKSCEVNTEVKAEDDAANDEAKSDAVEHVEVDMEWRGHPG
jgi:hypothetical protein